MKTTLRLLAGALLIVPWAGCGGSSGSSSAPVGGAAPTAQSIPVADGDHHVAEGFALVVPHGWRSMNYLATGPRKLHLSGDGVAAPELDETGHPLRIGVVVEKGPQTSDTLAARADYLVRTARANPALRFVGEAQTDMVELSDGTEALLLTMELIKKGYLRSLQMRLLARDQASHGWTVRAFVTGGKDSAQPVADSDLGRIVRGHVTSFCFDPAKLAEAHAGE